MDPSTTADSGHHSTPGHFSGHLASWVAFFLPILNNPYIQESIRFLLLGSVLETGRRVWQWLLDRFTSGFFVTAHFTQGDWAYDWLNEFLASQEIWTNSREFRVTASNINKEWAFVPGGFSSTEKATAPVGSTSDGHPRPLYFPASDMPQVMRWNGHWIQITRKPGVMTIGGREEGASLILTVYTMRKKVLDNLVEEARLHYLGTKKPPSVAQPKTTQLTLMATFYQGDWAYDWLLEFMNEQGAWQNCEEVIVTAKSVGKKWGMNLGGNDRDVKLGAYYQPASSNKHLWCWNGTWIEVQRMQGSRDYRTGKEEGACINLNLFTGRKEILDELVAAAAAQYWESSKARVTVHIAEGYGDWGATLTKSIRPMDSVILPAGVTDLIVNDLHEFIESKEWYAAAGIPWRRGILLWGEPGTGKSTTVHAIAGELSLEIYFLSIAANGIDDSALQRLVSSTPPNCILLLEDIDCAFPPRAGEEDEGDALSGKPFDPYSIGMPKSNVTLSGLLNLLDSVSSEEGRIVFATTNHIDRLDPAILRPGRMDLRIEYKLATTAQLRDLFKRFYSTELMSKFAQLDSEDSSISKRKRPVLSPEAQELIQMSDTTKLFSADELIAVIDNLAEEFSSKIPSGKFSIAQVQGYLLSKKRDPTEAVKCTAEWLKEREKEAEDKAKRLAKRAEERQKWERSEKRRAAREQREEEEEEREAALADKTDEKAEAEEKVKEDSPGSEPNDGEENNMSGSVSVTSEPVVVETPQENLVN